MWQNFVAEAARAMDEILRSFARFLPRFLEMLFIVVIGWVIAFILRTLLRSVLKIARFDKLSEHTGATQLLRGAALPLLGAVNADLPSPRLISWAMRTMIILFVVSMAFEELGVGSRTVIVAFALTFGSLMLGLALAFGLGGKDLARKYLERRFARDQFPERERKEREDELSPL